MQLTNATTMVVGPSGSGKSTLLATLAEWVWANYKKVTRYYSSDPGGYGDKIQALVNVGIIEVWRIRSRDPDAMLGLPMETVFRATQGYWPKVIDPATGNTEFGIELVAPRLSYYEMYCKNGHLAKKAQTKASLTSSVVTCETCKVEVSAATCKEILAKSDAAEGFERVGAYCFDSITSMSGWCMQDMAARMAKNQLGGEKAAISTLVSGALTLGGTNRSSVGFVQNLAEGWIQNSNAIKGVVVPPVWTSLELQTTDDNNVPVYGPKIAGIAKTSEIPSWVGNCLGTTIVVGEHGPEWRLYLQQYTKPGDSTPHLCKNRAIPGSLPEYLTEGPIPEKQAKDFEFTKFNLGYFFSLLEAELEKEEGKVRGRYSDLPGLPSGRLSNAPNSSAPSLNTVSGPKVPSIPSVAKAPSVGVMAPAVKK